MVIVLGGNMEKIYFYEQKKVNKIEKKIAFPMFCYILFLFLFWVITFFNPSQIFLYFLAILSLIFGPFILFYNYKKTSIIFSPINLVFITWGIIIPISSFSFPAMESMSALAWNKCLLTEMVALSTCLIFQKKGIRKINSFILSKSEEIILISILSISIIVLLYAYSQMGFIASSENVDSFRTIDLFPGFNILSNFGTICVPVLLANEKKRYKLVSYLLSIIYLILLVLSAIRFSFILCLCLLLSYFIFVNKKQLKIIILYIIAGLLVFVLASFIRRSANSIYYYFINTNIFSGSAVEFNLTEVFRYFGYSQRLMEQYSLTNVGGQNHAMFTLYPVLKMFSIEPEMVSLGDVYGYNANNLITFLYADYGIFWPVGVFLFYLLGTVCYNFKIARNSYIASYFWSVALFGMFFSFFTYFHQYVYWLTIYPIVLIVIHLFFGGEKNVKL